MKKAELKKINIRSFDFLISAAAAAVLLLAAYKILGVFVFGSNSLAAGDANLQYVPLMNELRERLLTGTLSGYSLANGLGTNFYATFFYYLASPVTVFSTLITPLSVFEAFDLAILIKCALSAAAFSYMQKKLNGSFEVIDTAFSLCYAGCGFFAASYFNIMWLDALIFLPLTAYGIKRLVSEGKGVFYTLSLAFALITCFYTGYMLCIFSVLYFLFNVLCDRKYVLLKLEKKSEVSDNGRNKALLGIVTRFALCSLAAGLIGAAVLLPVLSALQSSAVKAVTYPDILFGVKDFLFSHLFGITDPKEHLGSCVPVTYAGMLSLLMVPPFFFAKNIPLRERVLGGVLGVFMAASMLVYPIALAWHGFSAPAGFMPRFVFIYSFLLVCGACRAFKCIKSVHPVFIVLSALASAGIAIWSGLSSHPVSTFEKSGIFSLVFVLICTACVLLLRLKLVKERVVAVLLVLCVAMEFTASFCVNNVVLSAYPDMVENERALCDSVQDDESPAFRTLCSGDTLALGMLGSYYGINTIDTFSSFMDITATYAAANLGVSHNYANSVIAYETTPVFTSFMSIGHVYDFKDELLQKSLYVPVDTVKNDSHTELDIYSAKYSLPVAFCANKEYLQWNGLLFGVKSLENLFSCATGAKAPLFSHIAADSVTSVNAERTVENEGLYESIISSGSITEVGEDDTVYYFTIDDIKNASVTFTYTVTSPDPLYLSYSSNCLNDVTVTGNGRTVSRIYESGLTAPLIALPECKAGDTLTFTARLSREAENYEKYDTALIKASVYSLNMSAFEEGYNYLKEGALNVTEMTDSLICGTLTAKSNQVLYTSIVYDEGWSLYVDGKPAEIIKTNNHLLAAELTKGEHEIELRYRVPNLFLGAFLSLIGICLLMVEAYTEKPRQKNEKGKYVPKKSMFKF